jgi:hypothetical protein
MNYAYQNGDPRKLYHGMDYSGNLCGAGVKTNQPYLFWCSLGSGGMTSNGLVTRLDLHHPICIERCPSTGAFQHQCYDASTGMSRDASDYPTFTFAGRYCIPQDPEVRNLVQSKLSAHQVEKYTSQVAAGLRKAWPVLVGISFAAIFVCFMHMLFTECCAGMVIWGCLSFVILSASCLGAVLIWSSTHDGIDGMPGSGDSQTDLVLGIIVLAIATFGIMMAFCCRSAIRTCIQVVESAAVFVVHSRGVLFEPLLNLIARIVLWISMLTGFMWLLSVGDINSSQVHRSVAYTTTEWIFIIFYTVMMLWMNELCTACSQYVIAHAAARWFFTAPEMGLKKIEYCLLCHGYASMLSHFGSLCYGSFLIAMVRPVRVIVACMAYMGEVFDNDLCSCVSRVCHCAVGCFQASLIFLSKISYIEMAITSKPFCQAAKDGVALLANEAAHHKVITMLTGASWLFTVASIFGVSAFCGCVTHIVVSFSWPWNDPLSERYVEDPMVMVAVGALIGGVISFCFCLVFDCAADAMMICLCYDLKDMRENPPPKDVASEPKPQPMQTGFLSFFQRAAPAPAAGPSKSVTPKRPDYCHGQLQMLLVPNSKLEK